MEFNKYNNTSILIKTGTRRTEERSKNMSSRQRRRSNNFTFKNESHTENVLLYLF